MHHNGHQDLAHDINSGYLVKYMVFPCLAPQQILFDAQSCEQKSLGKGAFSHAADVYFKNSGNMGEFLLRGFRKHLLIHFGKTYTKKSLVLIIYTKCENLYAGLHYPGTEWQ